MVGELIEAGQLRSGGTVDGETGDVVEADPVLDELTLRSEAMEPAGIRDA